MEPGAAMELATILLVEDDLRLAASIADYLGRHGYVVAHEPRGERALARILAERPALVILDIGLPGEDGLSICRRARAVWEGWLLIVTARAAERDEALGLDLGADDYLAKPVSPRLLLAHVQALFRRQPRQREAPAQLAAGALRLDALRREACVGDTVLDLTPAEFELLWVLASYAGQTLDRPFLHARVRGGRWDPEDRSIDMRVQRLRQKLDALPVPPATITTVRGAGYAFAVL
jgi:DNA-binding response OmpR family regulator